jgi:hypothetical protein
MSKKTNGKFNEGSEAFNLRRLNLAAISNRMTRGERFDDLQGLSVEERRVKFMGKKRVKEEA